MTDPTKSPNILALIPAYNEGHRVAGVIQKTEKYLPVLVVDDGSTDDTAMFAEHAGAELLRQVPNQGKGAALMAGFRKAIELGYEAVVMLDADEQHDADEIPKFIAAYQSQGADLIIGQRDFRYMPIGRRTTNTIGTYLFSWAIGQWVPDNQSGYRLLSKRMMETMLESHETNFEFEVEMILQCVLNKYRLSWVPIRTIYGDEKSHIRPLRHGYHYMRIVFQTRRAMQNAKK